MFLVTIALALAGFAQAQDSSSTLVSSQSQSSQSQDSSAVQSTSQFKLPLYPPYPIASTTAAPASGSASASASASSSALISSYQSDKYWQHTYRDYYASIITVLSTSTLVYKIDCAPNSAHPSYKQPDFQSFDVCAARIVGRGPMTVTQDPSQWIFADYETQSGLNLTQTRFDQATTSTRLDVTCKALQEKTKTCSNMYTLAENQNTSAVAAPSLPSGLRSRSTSVSISGDGASQQRQSQIDSLLENFSTMSEVLVTVTGGFDKLSPSMMSSLLNDASGVVSAVSSHSASPSASASSGAAESASTAGAAARPTGAVKMEVLFGAAGLLGAAVFGL